MIAEYLYWLELAESYMFLAASSLSKIDENYLWNVLAYQRCLLEADKCL